MSIEVIGESAEVFRLWVNIAPLSNDKEIAQAINLDLDVL
jgi:hypothetical protein